MARISRRPQATRATDLEPVFRVCPGCGAQLYAVYCTARTVTTLEGLCRLTRYEELRLSGDIVWPSEVL